MMDYSPPTSSVRRSVGRRAEGGPRCFVVAAPDEKKEEEGGLSLLDCEDSLLNLLLAPLHSRDMRGKTAKVNSALAGEAGRI